MTKLVIPCLLIRIVQNLIGLIDFLEVGFRLLITRIEIRMILLGELTVCFFYFIICGVFRHTHNLIIVSLI